MCGHSVHCIGHWQDYPQSTPVLQPRLIVHIYPVTPVGVVTLQLKGRLESELVANGGENRGGVGDTDDFPLRADLAVEYPCDAAHWRLCRCDWRRKDLVEMAIMMMSSCYL